MKVLITGGAGFVGSNYVHHTLKSHSSWYIINLDKLTYAGNLGNISDLEEHQRHTFVQGDIADATLMEQLFSQEKFELVVNFAAETHVDRSIIDPAPFMRTNALGTQTLLEASRRHGVKKFLHLSTPEVYGGIQPGQEFFTEESPFAATNPYSASKTAADIMCLAYHHTYGLDISFTRFANAYGPNQYPEKLVPLATTHALQDKPIPLYGQGQYRRNWIHVDEICRALDIIIEKGRSGAAYNIGSGYEMSNLEIVRRILAILGKPPDLITFVPDRPGHDWQYPLDSTRIKTELGWELTVNFEEALEKTVNWYTANRPWWQNLEVLDYREQYRQIAESRGNR
ncbi:dTDP-glucose 4,6-dehydratase [Chloroflexota bacterium]